MGMGMVWGTVLWTALFGVITLRAGVVALAVSLVVVVNLGLRAIDSRRGAALRQAVVFTLFCLAGAVHQTGVDRRARRAEEVNAGVQLRWES